MKVLTKTMIPVVFGLAASIASMAPASAQKLPELTAKQQQTIRGEKNEQAIAALPKNYQFVKEGQLTVGIHPWRLPLGVYGADNTSLIGYNIDLGQLIADSLGLQLNFVVVEWADWPLGLRSGRFDAVISNVTVTEERKERFDFATYRQDLLGFYAKKDSPLAPIHTPKNIAGLRLITDAGTNQERLLLEWDKQNVAAGLKPIQLQYYDDEAVRSLALEAGRADAIFSVNATLAYETSVKNNLKLLGTFPGGWPSTAEVAVTTAKGNGLVEALALAINALIANGQQGQILDKWNLSEEAIEQSLVNPPGLQNF